MAIPIGQEYQVNGGLSYRFMLVYSSTVWDISERFAKPNNYPYTRAEVGHTANAGLGWTLTLGQFFAPGAGGNLPGKYTYVSPDGSQHTFYGSLHFGDSVDSNYLYTRDGSYLRAHIRNNGLDYDIESPDGTVRSFHRSVVSFTSPFYLTGISDRFGNVVLVNSMANPWTIFDGHRTHLVHFTTVAGATVVDWVKLAAFGDTGAPSAKYQFHYGASGFGVNSPTTIEEDCRDTDPDTGTGEHGDIAVPLLTAVDLPANGGSLRLPAYYTSCSYTPPGGMEETIRDLPVCSSG